MNQQELEKLEGKLLNAVGKLGLSWSIYSGIIEIADHIGDFELTSACWYYDDVSKKEKVAISPDFIKKLTVHELGIIIKHELLHKAMLRNIEGADNFELKQIAMDVTINKILYLSNPPLMIKVCKKTFEQDTKATPLALSNCSINSQERLLIPSRIRELFDELYWVEDKQCVVSELINCANSYVPDPYDMYCQLSIMLTDRDKKNIVGLPQKCNEKQCGQGEEQGEEGKEEREEGREQKQEGKGEQEGKGKEEEKKKGENEEENAGSGGKEEKEQLNEEEEKGQKERYHIRGGDGNLRAQDKQCVDQEVSFARDIKNKISGTSYSALRNIREIFDKRIFNPQNCATQTLKDFISNWNTKHQIQGVESIIACEMRSNAKWEPYPNSLTRMGIQYVVAGISGPDTLPLYLNKSNKVTGKKRICCYFDVSGSMYSSIPHMCHIVQFIDQLEECDLYGKYKFAGRVDKISEKEWGEFTKGKVRAGFSTSFEAVVKHAIKEVDQNQCDVIAIFTDGESRVGKETIGRFNKTGKKAYPIYFYDPNSYSYIKRKGNNIMSDLDKLNGRSFTINLPKK